MPSTMSVSKKILAPIASPDHDSSNNCGCVAIPAAVGTNKQDPPPSSSTVFDISLTTSVSAPSIVCRICYSTCGTLYAFCKCKGSVGYVHKECLKRWIDTKLKANRCEICQAPFCGTDWSFKPISKWATPKMCILDKLYLALFVCCSVIVLYSIPWISYKAWRSRDVIFGDGPVTSERVFALIVIAIYVPLNISCIASLVVLWRRAVASVLSRFLDANKRWRVRVTKEVAETKLINAVNSTNKSPGPNHQQIVNNNSNGSRLATTTPIIKKLSSSPRRPGSNRIRMDTNSTEQVDKCGSTNLNESSASVSIISESTTLTDQQQTIATADSSSTVFLLRSIAPTDV